YIEDHEIKEYLGTYDEYVFWKSLQEEKPVVQKSIKKEKPIPEKNIEKDPETNQARRDLKKKERDLSEIEEKITALESDRVKLESQMADPSVYQNDSKAAEINASYAA